MRGPSRAGVLDFGSNDLRIPEINIVLRRMAGYRPDIVESRWVIVTKHRSRPWEVIVEPDPESERLVIVTAYPVEES
jgi:hypothetical protein